MDLVLHGMEEFAAADIVIFSCSWQDHVTHLKAILEALRRAGLTVKLKKCQLGMAQCSYLGHVVGSGVVRPELDKVRAIQEFPIPVTKKDVRAFLGISGYYRKFIPNYSAIATPLTNLTKKKAPSNVIWTETCEEAFKQLKHALSSEPILNTPDFNKLFILQTDASEYGVGAVLSQRGDDDLEHPVGYFSRKLLEREVKYSTINNREWQSN